MSELNKNISALRKKKGITQEELAEGLGVTAQAVSKWENEISCPDIQLLPKIAELFDVSIDALMGVSKKNDVVMSSGQNKKSFEDLILRIKIRRNDGEKVNINLPMPVVKAAVEMGINMSIVNSNISALNNIDIDQIISLAEQGVLGNLLEVDSGHGDIVNICIE